MKQIYIIFILFVLISCSRENTITSNETSNSLKGKVVNNSGEAIPDVEIVINYYLEEFEMTSRDLTPNNGAYMVITKHQSPSDTVKVISNDSHPNSFTWNGKNLENKNVLPGYYDYYIHNSDSLVCTNKCLLLQDYTMQTGIISNDFEIIAKTDSNGYFEISYDKFSFHFDDNIVELVNENGEQEGYGKLSQFIKIWTFADDYYSTFNDSVFVNSTTGANLEIVMDHDF